MDNITVFYPSEYLAVASFLHFVMSKDFDIYALPEYQRANVLCDPAVIEFIDPIIHTLNNKLWLPTIVYKLISTHVRSIQQGPKELNLNVYVLSDLSQLKLIADIGWFTRAGENTVIITMDATEPVDWAMTQASQSLIWFNTFVLLNCGGHVIVKCRTHISQYRFDDLFNASAVRLTMGRAFGGCHVTVRGQIQANVFLQYNPPYSVEFSTAEGDHIELLGADVSMADLILRRLNVNAKYYTDLASDILHERKTHKFYGAANYSAFRPLPRIMEQRKKFKMNHNS